ncbi:unnamed protein product [Prunus brigantina]
MAPKKIPVTILESSSSEDTIALPDFISGPKVKDFAAVFDHWVYRFVVGQVDFILCKYPITFVNDYCILGPRYVDWKSDQLWNYETHPIQAPIPVCHAEGVDWSNWNKMLPRASNTFDFGIGPMSISILDLAVIFRFRPHGQSADWLRDFQECPSKEQEQKKNLEILSGLIGSNRDFGAFMAEGLASHRDIATGPLVLGSIYRALREATVVPVNLHVKGALWMVQIWLQWTDEICRLPST